MPPWSAPRSGGFSSHAAVFIEAADGPGLERLLRYCARPAFASERFCWGGSDQPVRYSVTKPLPTGQTELTFTPLELLDLLWTTCQRLDCTTAREVLLRAVVDYSLTKEVED